MTAKNTLAEVLHELGVQVASDVTLRSFRNPRGATVQATHPSATTRAEAMARGECVAHSPRGKTTTITAAAALALVAAGAKDERDEAPGAP